MAKKVLQSEGAKEKIAKAIAGGQTQTAVARSSGVSQSTISRLANKQDVKVLIQAETMKLMEAVPQAVENLKSLVYEMAEIPKKEIKRRELSFKATTKVLESVGMLNSPSLSPTFVNIVPAQGNR
jgi:transcriptional regulator with XRE-family HTH domain